MVFLANGQVQRGREILEQELARAQEVGDRYREKTILDHLGALLATVGANRQAFETYERALSITKEVGDRQHQADLLWLLAIQHAQLGEEAAAVTTGRMAIDLYEELANPNTAEFVEILRQYSLRTTGLNSPGNGQVLAQPEGSSIPANATRGTRPLWNVFLAAKSIAKFFASGMKWVTPNAYRERLLTCATCPHHTGVRCRVCSCFTNLKAWMPHERCPIGKWSQSISEEKGSEVLAGQ